MAQIQLGPLISDIKGSIGGVTFSRNASGICAKTRLVGKRNLTTKQAIALQVTSAIANLWQNLLVSERLLWNAYGIAYTHSDRYGKVKTLTGYNWFLLINTVSYYHSRSFVSTPPAHILPAFLPSFRVLMSLEDISISFDLAVDTVKTGIMIYSSTPTRSNAQYNRSAYRLHSVAAVNYSELFSIKTLWESTHKLSYDSVVLSGNFNISVLIQPFDKRSFVTGTAVTQNGNYAGGFLLSQAGVQLLNQDGTPLKA